MSGKWQTDVMKDNQIIVSFIASSWKESNKQALKYIEENHLEGVYLMTDDISDR